MEVILFNRLKRSHIYAICGKEGCTHSARYGYCGIKVYLSYRPLFACGIYEADPDHVFDLIFEIRNKCEERPPFPCPVEIAGTI